ncbi:hexitol phosphatase HxpB [Shewanella sp. NIFS-20-20]|uniref:hexitol phosphatase HxpB n=1 Tax=Shewanella sp. NIFS-20-20 TaxID=2853806 RepID=UPI001C495B13|nr:hexitol phosphatase HxpB [Shewanella sp. NIFS-20-20]MBV7316477.1 hexitol phosphatase HxpB [Shewanella sp. NIFS-20-20]
MAAIDAVIFDMDGVLIDSEPQWQQAEIAAFADVGIHLSHADVLNTTGLRVDQVVEYWYQRRPWPDYNNAAVSAQISRQLVDYILQDGQALNGVEIALQACQLRGLKLGLATSSPTAILDAVMTRLRIGHYFDACCSAEGLAYGKPHPQVYLNCAAMLNVAPSRCLAIEDSINGMIAARAANMLTLVIPAAEQVQHLGFGASHYQLTSLQQLPALLDQIG